MTTSRMAIDRWFDEGKKSGKDYMIIACDTYDWTDYPVYADESDFEAEFNRIKYTGMQRIMEVYNLSLDKFTQLEGKRVFNFPESFRKES